MNGPYVSQQQVVSLNIMHTIEALPKVIKFYTFKQHNLFGENVHENFDTDYDLDNLIIYFGHTA